VAQHNTQDFIAPTIFNTLLNLEIDAERCKHIVRGLDHKGE